MHDKNSVAIAAPSEAAAAAGRRVADDGGNAVDAALAASLVTLVNEPGIVSLGCGAFVTVQPPIGPPLAVDGWVEMPGRDTGVVGAPDSTWDITTAYGGGTTMTIGPGSVGTHGALAGFDVAHRRWGVLPWSEIVAPAIEVARTGFTLSTATRHYLEFVHQDIYGWDAASRALLHDRDGALVGPDDRVVLADLADSLEQIAADGASVLYTGDLGRAISAAVIEAGGLLSEHDLAAYEPVVRTALSLTAGDWALGTNPPPSVGGVCVAAMLLLLDGRPHGEWTPADTDLLVQIQRSVLRHRLDELDWAADLSAAAGALLDRVGSGGLIALESASTTHVSAVDSEGRACAVTASAGYGAGMIAPGTGIWLNNCLGEQELNRDGVHALAAGTRLSSNMAPTVGRRADGSALAIGSPGADRISTAVVQVLAGFVGGMSLRDAIDQPRLHVRLSRTPGVVDVLEHEDDLPVDPDGMAHLSLPPHSMYFGGVAAAVFDATTGLSAAGDPRRGGAVAIGGAP